MRMSVKKPDESLIPPEIKKEAQLETILKKMKSDPRPSVRRYADRIIRACLR
jgi:hypothetical protein